MRARNKKPAPAVKSDFQRACEEADALIDDVTAKIKALGADVVFWDDDRIVGRHRISLRAERGCSIGYRVQRRIGMPVPPSDARPVIFEWSIAVRELEILDSGGDEQIFPVSDKSRRGPVSYNLRSAGLPLKLEAVARLPFFLDEYKQRVEELVKGVREAARELKAGGK